jgi:hypothetical protein
MFPGRRCRVKPRTRRWDVPRGTTDVWSAGWQDTSIEPEARQNHRPRGARAPLHDLQGANADVPAIPSDVVSRSASHRRGGGRRHDDAAVCDWLPTSTRGRRRTGDRARADTRGWGAAEPAHNATEPFRPLVRSEPPASSECLPGAALAPVPRQRRRRGGSTLRVSTLTHGLGSSGCSDDVAESSVVTDAREPAGSLEQDGPVEHPSTRNGPSSILHAD